MKAWRQVPRTIGKAIEGLTEQELDLRGGSEDWSVREVVHHLVEANLIASNIVIAALARSGVIYDWSWVYPNPAWLKRVGYDKAPVGPALELLDALCHHIGGLLRASPDAPQRKVRLLDAPGARLHAKTIEEVLRDEVEHVKLHLRDLRAIRKQHAR